MAVSEKSSTEPISDLALVERLCIAITSCSADELWVRRGRWLRVRCLIAIGNETVMIVIDHGELSLRHRLPPLFSWDFAIRGTTRAWAEFWQRTPAPGWHDLLALSKRGEVHLEGNLHPLMANLQYFKDLLALPRDGGR